MTLESAFNRTRQVITDNSPSILAALAVGGVVTTGLVAHKAGYDYGRDVEFEIQQDPDFRLTGKQKFERYWRSHAPIFVFAGGAITCIIAGTAISNRRNAALASLVTLGEVALRDYKEEVRRIVTKQKNEEIDRSVAQKKLDDQGEDREVIYVGDGDIEMFDVLTSRTFKSSKLAVQRAEVEIGRRLLSDMYISQNEWYDEIGLPRVAMGDDVGWNHDLPLEVKFIPLEKNEKPVLGIDYRFHPSISFNRFG